MSLDALIVTLISAWTGAWRALGKTHSLKDIIRNANGSETKTPYMCYVIAHTKTPHSTAHLYMPMETLKPSGPLPIQAIIQAAFFSLIIRRSTVACSCFITRQRLHIHIDICDRKGD